MRVIAVLLMVEFMVACTAQSVGKTDLPTKAGVAAEGLRLAQTIPLPNVEGRIDHLSVDLKNKRLFVAALGNDTLEVLDLSAGKVIQTISDLSEPQGVLFIPELNKIYVTNGGSGVCQVFDGDSFKPIGRIEFSGDADNLRYDPDTKSIYVGYGNGALGIVDTVSQTHMGDIELDGHPESFQLAQSAPSIFVNIPSANQIAVVDRIKRTVIAIWSLEDAKANYPMALDESHHRLFVGFRQPAKLNVYDTKSGNMVVSLDSVGDVDDIFYDAMRQRIYLVGGEGFIDIIEQADANHYQLLTQVSIAPGARTGLFVPELNQLYVAVPHRGNQQAEVRIYEGQP
jgi:DNA-binding beta-propeller fold protein YncE